MNGLAINQIITIANAEMQLARDRLEVEESGREVASLQGHIIGYKKLIGIMAAELGLTQIAIEDLGDKPLIVPDMDDETLAVLTEDIGILKAAEEWGEVQQRIEEDIETMKNHRLFAAEKSRDLDLCQGQYEGETVYTRLFNSVESENGRREAERERKRKNPELFPEKTA